MVGSIVRYGAATLAALFFVLVWSFTSGDPLGFGRFQSAQVLVFALLLYPVCEEIIFRGVVQAELLRWARARSAWMQISLANLMASGLFALAHVAYFQTAMAAVVFVPSLAFGWIYQQNRHLSWPILLHSSFNALGLLAAPLF